MRRSSWSAREDSRIRAHLLGALEVLRQGDVDALDASARAARARNIEELERYVAAGRFPRSPFREGPRQPALIDEWGTRCALAHLIEQSGGGTLLARLRGLGNHAWVRELAGDAGLVSWLGAAGMTASEAARIQPSYSHYPTAFECACTNLWRGGAIGKIVSVDPVSESAEPRRCRVQVEEILAFREAKPALVVGGEVEAICPDRPFVGGKVLLADERNRKSDRLRTPSGMVAHPIVADAVMMPATCDLGGALQGEPKGSAKISIARMREATKGESAACQSTLEGRKYDPPPPRPAPSPRLPAAPPAPAKPQASAAPAPAPDARPVEQAEEKPAPPLEPSFPQPVHYFAAGGTLLVAGTAVYFVLRRRS